jgi:hypothetical protein
MQSSPTYNLLGLLAAGLPPSADYAPARADLNGTWRCDDGGLYFVRQIGPDVLWYGEGSSDRPFFANVAHGRMEDDGRIRLMWADVPKGTTGKCGALVLHVGHDGEMHAVTATGGFGGRVWTR